MINLANVMNQLAQHRPVFHSEADFQHALAWQLHQMIPSARVRLEYCPVPGVHLDIWVATDDGSLALELKYLTKGYSANVNGERFELRNHAAQPPGRYNFVDDITSSRIFRGSNASSSRYHM